MRICLALAIAVVPLAGCRPKPTDAAPTGDDRNTTFREGDSYLKNSVRAAQRTATLNDFHQIGIIALQYEIANGAWPGIDELKAELKGDGNAILKKIEAGAILLTGTKDAKGLVAYEVDADKIGGMVLVGTNARKATASEVTELLSKP